MTTNDRFAAQEIDQTIRKNLAKLRKPGVLTVRPGFEITGDQLTGKQAIVATVHTKKKPADIARGELLPAKIGRFPVDVREANADQRLRVVDPAAAALSELYARPEQREPSWPLEREMPSGKLLDNPAGNPPGDFRARGKATAQIYAAGRRARAQSTPTQHDDHGGGEPGCRLRNPVEISRRHAAFAGDRDVRLHVRLPAE